MEFNAGIFSFTGTRKSPCRFNSEMQQAGIKGMAERAVGEAGGVKGLSPTAMRAKRAPLRPPALSTTLSQAVYAGGQVKTILAWDFHPRTHAQRLSSPDL
jgi:hypothetical protein